MACLGGGGGVVVSGVTDLPCGVFQQTLTANPPQGPSSAPGGQGVANLIVGKAFDGVRGTMVVAVSVGKKSRRPLALVPRQSTVLASCSDTSGSPG